MIVNSRSTWRKFSFLIVVSWGLGACESIVDVPADPPTVPRPVTPPPVNRAPERTGQMPAHEIAVGGTSTQNVADFFYDPDGDELTYGASSSHEGVVTVSMDGTVVTMMGVADGKASVMVTASDPDGASAAHVIAVTVGDGDNSNQAPVATSDIPDLSVRMGDAVKVNASNHFSDPDGDELSYTASSSNSNVATVIVRGSTATITGVAVGSAVVTITASDGSASTSQGFSVTVSKINAAAGTIVSLRPVVDRNGAVDPTNVSGDVTVLLDVQPNDETVTAVALVLGDMLIPCRGTSTDRAMPLGLADSGAVIECFFDTDAITDECTGMQLKPQFANGEYELGARITVADGGTRDVPAQQITLNNSNYIIIDHNPGSRSVIVAGVTYYGGPTTEDNVNTFDICPVAFDGTAVGQIGLRGMTQTKDGNSLAFRAHRRSDLYGEFWGVRVTDSEPPFTFIAHSSWNGRGGFADDGVEDIADEDNGGHWIIQDGTIFDPDGLDITDRFTPSDPENGLTKIGPIYFDFNPPRLSGDGDTASEILIGDRRIQAGMHYSNFKSGRPQAFSVSRVSEAGSGGSQGIIMKRIDVGDCSNRNNVDTGLKGATTPFVPIVADVKVVGDLAERASGRDSRCYTAELQWLADPLGNWRRMSRNRIQGAAFFGVDSKAPVIVWMSYPSGQVRVLKDSAVITLEVEDPDLSSGALGSGVDYGGIIVYAGESYSRRYWDGSSSVRRDAAGRVVVQTNVSRTRKIGSAEDGRHKMTVMVSDRSSPKNWVSSTIMFVRDTKPPSLNLNKFPSNIGGINAESVIVTIGGTIVDDNVIHTAELTLWRVDTASSCLVTDSQTGRVLYDKRILHNVRQRSSKIEFDESFTIYNPRSANAEPTTYCFLLDVEDSARMSDGSGKGNRARYHSTFDIQWY